MCRQIECDDVDVQNGRLRLNRIDWSFRFMVPVRRPLFEASGFIKRFSSQPDTAEPEHVVADQPALFVLCVGIDGFVCFECELFRGGQLKLFGRRGGRYQLSVKDLNILFHIMESRLFAFHDDDDDA